MRSGWSKRGRWAATAPVERCRPSLTFGLVQAAGQPGSRPGATAAGAGATRRELLIAGMLQSHLHIVQGCAQPRLRAREGEEKLLRLAPLAGCGWL